MVKVRLLPILFAIGGTILATTACSPSDNAAGSRSESSTAGAPSKPGGVQTAALTSAPGAVLPPAAPAPAPGERETGDDVALRRAAGRGGSGGVSILQIGDSHTAADYFTGEVRRILQARYGDGGVGYLDVGQPHPGLHKVALAVSADAGWSYQGIQRSGEVGQFALTGFLAQTSRAGQSLGFASRAASPYTDLEVEAQTGPGQGGIDISVDGRLARHVDLSAPEAARSVIGVPVRGGRGTFHRLDIRTTTAAPVTVLSVFASDRRHGLTYSNIGFPGATVDILNKFPEATVARALDRLHPQIVVLSFGTNEGFNDSLDLVRYRARYEAVIRTIRSGVPDAEIVMIAPADANRLPADCRRDRDSGACRSALDAALRAAPAAKGDCPWPTPPQLDRVRDLQRDIAAKDGIAFWDWSTIMPEHCGAETWVTSSPPLMTPDHVHFTAEGYRRGGRAFADFIEPLVDRLVGTRNVVSDN